MVPFKDRDVATLLSKSIKQDNSLDIWINITACDFEWDDGGRVKSVTAHCRPGDKSLMGFAPYVLVAADAIESTRLLLLLDQQYDKNIFSPDGVLGHYFYDHLSALAGIVAPGNRS